MVMSLISTNADVSPEAMVDKIIFGKIDFNIWFSSVTEGRYSNYDEVNYIEGSCPNAEYATKHIINFPTHLQIDISYLEKVFSKNKKSIKNLLH